MTSPYLYLTRMLLFVVAVAALGAAFFTPLHTAFLSNPGLNALILGILVLGIFYICRQVFLLVREVRWIETYRSARPGISSMRPPRLLAPMASMLGERRTRLSLSAMAMRTLLDGISARLDEAREISRYLIGLLIFLGLLGTFWGLMETVSTIASVIGGLSAGAGDIAATFEDLKRGLQAPLGGMGTAFSSSLFGLAGSLVLGFLELQAGQAQNRFFNDLEDWLSSQTKLSTGALGVEGGGDHVSAYVQALLEQTADSLESLQRTIERGEESRIASSNGIMTLAEKLSMLTDQMRTEQSLLVKLAENQMELKPVLAKLADPTALGGMRFDDGMRGHIRNLDVQMARLIEETSTGRMEMTQDLRSEIRLLSRTLAALAEKAR